MTPARCRLPAGFQFVGDTAEWGVADERPDSGSLVVRLPRGLNSTRALLQQYVQQLRLPDYFGWNFDALDECLRDLHWLPEGCRVALVHAGLPLRRGSRGRRTYVELLRDAVAAWPAGDRLVAVFPEHTHHEIAAVLAATSP